MAYWKEQVEFDPRWRVTSKGMQKKQKSMQKSMQKKQKKVTLKSEAAKNTLLMGSWKQKD
jgi:hypothetical protein